MTPNPKHLVLNLLLAAEGEAMQVADAVSACALFGVRENSVRVALVRLTTSGMIEAAGRGSYRLGPQAAGLAGDVASWRSSEKRVRPWKGDWIAVHLGGLRRSDRVAQRARDRALALLGLRELEPHLFIRPDNLAGGVIGVRERLHKLGLDMDAPVFVAQQFDEAREQQARKLWDGKALSKTYRETRRKLDSWLARADQLEPDVAARESYLVGHEAIRQLVFDPLLPEPLVDVDERHAFVETVVKFDRAGHAIWQGLQSVSPIGRAAAAVARRTH